MKTTLLPGDYFLQDNQIHFKSRTEHAGCEIEIEGQRIVMGASTDHTLPAVKQLDRTLFVKPMNPLAEILDTTPQVMSLPTSIIVDESYNIIKVNW